MVEGFGERCLLKSRSVTKSPAVIPLSGTSQSVSENRRRAGLVQICFWSSKNRLPSPSKLRCELSNGSASGSLTIFFAGVTLFTSAPELFSFVSTARCSCACGGAGIEEGAVSVRLDAAQLSTSTMTFICIKIILRHGWMYATAKATDEAICADCMISAQLRPPIFGAFSRTTIVSPARKVALIGAPPHQPPLLFLAVPTKPCARLTQPPLSA